MKRLLKYGTNTLFTILMVLAIFVITVLFSSEHHKRFDFSEGSKYSLDEKSINVVKALKQDIDILVFYNRGSNFKDRAEDMLTQYEFYNKKFKVKYLETNKHPEEAKSYDLADVNSLVLKTPQRKEVLTSANLTEEDFTNSLLKITETSRTVVAFLTGHGERSVTEDSQQNYTVVNEALKKENYETQELNLNTESDIPMNINLLIIAGPKVSLADNEIKIIRNFITRGGSLMVLMEPGYENDRLINLISEYGVVIGKEYVVDNLGAQFFKNPLVAVVPINLYGDSPIVKNFKLNTFFPICCPVVVMKPKEGAQFHTLMKTSPFPISWAKILTSNMTEEQMKFVKGKDMPGPVSLGVAGTVPLNRPKGIAPDKTTARMVIIGNVNFATNEFAPAQGNKNLFMNCISWLSEKENLISLRKDQKFPKFLSMNEEEKKKIFVTTVLILPLLVLIAGIVMVWNRR